MAVLRIYSVAYNRPEFIELQYSSVVKHIQKQLKPGWELDFWILVNTKDVSMKEQLVQECIRLEVKCQVVPYNESELYNGGLTAYNYVRDHFFPKTGKNDYSIIMDCDMFLYNSMDIEKLLDGSDVAAIYHQREKKLFGLTVYNYEYLWVGFMVFNHKNFDWKGIKFDPIKNICDVGGMTSYYLKDNTPKGLKVKWLKHTADITDEFKNIFPSYLWKYYEPGMGFQIIENSIIHYYRGSNWNGSDRKFIEAKDLFLNVFLRLLDGKSLSIGPSNHFDSLAYSRKHFNGIVNNENKALKPKIGEPGS